MDQMVQVVQEWLNETYENSPGYEPVAEDGITGWGTIRALIRALQIEIGIAPDGNIGPATMSLCPTLSTASSEGNLVKIVQGSLFCKGYNPTGFTGTYGVNTRAAIMSLQSDAGLSNPDGITTPLIFKALLTMDSFVNLGDTRVRTIQQNLNRDYSHIYGTKIGLIPCDGLKSKMLITGLIYGLQVEEGNSAPDGIWGPNTFSLIPTLSVGSTRLKQIQILRYGLYINNFDPLHFTGIFDNPLKSVVMAFQTFCGLTADGIAGKQTFASLLISYGDKNRIGTACDCVTTITPERAQTLKNAGYLYIGRYIVGGDFKKIKPGELDTIFAAGLKVFPIHQTSGSSVNYFTPHQGAKDAVSAINAGSSYGFKRDTIIYFAVDFDCLDYQVTSNILPYFQALFNTMTASGSKYRIGIYGPRNACSRVSNAGYAVTSFVSDMSSGFSGNLGYPLPSNWAFDQITTITLGTNTGQIEIDKNIASGRDPGVSSVEAGNVVPFDPKQQNELCFSYFDTIYNLALEYTNNDVYGANQKVLQYIRTKQNYVGLIWDLVAGFLDEDFIALVDTTLGNPAVEKLYDLDSGIEVDIEHLCATANSYTYLTDNDYLVFFAGMIGDLICVAGESVERYLDGDYVSVYEAAKSLICTPIESGSQLSMPDFLADMDAYNIGKMMNDNSTLKFNDALRTYYSDINYYIDRYAKWTLQYGDLNHMESESHYLLTGSLPIDFALVRDEKFKPTFEVHDYSDAQAADVIRAYREAIEARI